MASSLASFGRILKALATYAPDPRWVEAYCACYGTEGLRAQSIAGSLNRVRGRAPKKALILRNAPFAAATRFGQWIYIQRDLARVLPDDALAFVLAHEMAHHDLGHLTPIYISAGWLGNWQQIELAADREGMRLVVAAGYSPARALRALDPDLLGEEPHDPLADWFPELAQLLDRVRRTHPSLEHRRQQLEEWLQTTNR